MNKIKNILLEHLNCTQVHNKNLVFIILSYCTPYYEEQIKIVCDYTAIIKELTNNRLAIGLYNGTIHIYDLATKSTIVRNPKSYSNKEPWNKDCISAFCQTDENTIVCGMQDHGYILIWNFKNNTEEIIRCAASSTNNIVMLEKDIIAMTSWATCTYIINLKTRQIKEIHYHNYKMSVIHCVISFENKFLIGSAGHYLKTVILNKDDYLSSIYDNTKIQVVPAKINPRHALIITKCTTLIM